MHVFMIVTTICRIKQHLRAKLCFSPGLWKCIEINCNFNKNKATPAHPLWVCGWVWVAILRIYLENNWHFLQIPINLYASSYGFHHNLLNQAAFARKMVFQAGAKEMH